jgi:DNA repair exonuclease SbcCD nuclease subunit
MLAAMRIAAIGDAHLGRTATTATTAEGVNQREFDFEQSLLASVDGALNEQPDLLVWLGDIFDHPRPNYRSFRVAMQALAKIRAHGIGLVAISGNHDTPRLPGVGNPYAVLADAFPEFHFAYRLEYEAFDLPGLRVHAVPQTKTSEDTLDALHAADRGRSLDRVNLLITHPLVHSVERRYADMNEIEIDDRELQSDLVLLGHYHTYCAVPERRNVWYAGSTDTFSFADDPHRPKGFVVLDTESGMCRHETIAGQRKLVTPDPVEAFGRSPAELSDEITQRLLAEPEGAVARLALEHIEPDVYRMLDLQGIFHDAGHLLHIKLEPHFYSTTTPVQDLPELSTIGARWNDYVATQPNDDLDRDRLRQTGIDYLERAIDAAIDPGSAD